MTARVISALIAAAVLVGAAILFKTMGLYVVGSIVVFGCIYEFTKLTLVKGESPEHINFSFGLLAAFTYVATVLRTDLAIYVAALSAIIVLAMLVISVRRSNDLGHAFKIASAALVGLFYVGLFPGLAVSLLGLSEE